MTIQLRRCLLGLLAMAYLSVITAQSESTECTNKASKCFIDAGWNLNDPKISNFIEQMGNYEHASIAASVTELLDLLCERKDSVKQVFHCLKSLADECLNLKYQGFIPSTDVVEKVIDRVCDSRKDLNMECIEQQIRKPDSLQCFKDQENRVEMQFGRKLTNQEILCSLHKILAVCLKRMFTKCGCKTTTPILDILDILYPESCPASNTTRVVCRGADGSADTGAHSFWTWNILIVFLFAMTLSRLY